MQGVIVSFDPTSTNGIVMVDSPDRTQYALSPDALVKSAFTMLRQGQRVNFEVDENKLAINVRLGSEVDMGISTARV